MPWIYALALAVGAAFLYWNYAHHAVAVALKFNVALVAIARSTGNRRLEDFTYGSNYFPHMRLAFWIVRSRSILWWKLYILRTTESYRMGQVFAAAFNHAPNPANTWSHYEVETVLLTYALEAELYRTANIPDHLRWHTKFESESALIRFYSAVKAARYFGYEVSGYWRDHLPLIEELECQD